MSPTVSPLFAFRIAKKVQPSGTLVGSYDAKQQLWVKNAAEVYASWMVTDMEVFVSSHEYYNTVDDYETDDGINPIHTDSNTGLDDNEDQDQAPNFDYLC